MNQSERIERNERWSKKEEEETARGCNRRKVQMHAHLLIEWIVIAGVIALGDFFRVFIQSGDREGKRWSEREREIDRERERSKREKKREREIEERERERKIQRCVGQGA